MMRYQHQPQAPFHESLAPTWAELTEFAREGGYDQIRGLYLHRRPGTDTGSLEARFLRDIADALEESDEEDLETDLDRIRDQIHARAIIVDAENLVGLAISGRDETGETITILGVFTDGTRHEITASHEDGLSSKVVFADDEGEPNPIAAAMMGLLDAVIGDRHEQVTHALHDALALCLRNGLQAAIGIWEQAPGIYQARPYPDLGQSLIAASQAGVSLEAALERAARDLRSRQQRKPTRPPAGLGWIRYDGSTHRTKSIVGIAVLDGWVYFGSWKEGQVEREWTIFPRAATGGGERELVDALQQVPDSTAGPTAPLDHASAAPSIRPPR